MAAVAAKKGDTDLFNMKDLVKVLTLTIHSDHIDPLLSLLFTL
jgi:hypothetical protein